MERGGFTEPESFSVLMVDILYSWQQHTCEIELTKNNRGNYRVKAFWFGNLHYGLRASNTYGLFLNARGTRFKKDCYQMKKTSAYPARKKKDTVNVINLSLTFLFVLSLEGYWSVSVHLQGNCVSLRKRQFWGFFQLSLFELQNNLNIKLPFMISRQLSLMLGPQLSRFTDCIWLVLYISLWLDNIMFSLTHLQRGAEDYWGCAHAVFLVCADEMDFQYCIEFKE